jgi:hypothetical protein
MKKLVLFVFLFASFQAFGQFPNYTNINGRYKWIAGKFDSTFTIPSGTTPSLRTGGGTGPGALFYRTTDSTVYQYTGTQWIKLRAGVSPTDTAGIWISNVYRKTGTDSVYYVKGGTSTFAFRDSIGNVGGGGGGGKIYYFNGGVNLGTFAGITMYELGDTAVTSAAANFTRATTGNLANFITDVNRPGLLQIPAGVWTVDAYLSETGGGSNHAQIWIEVEKWDGSTITTIATSPIEEITNGNVIDLYTWSVSIPTTTLAVTDRIIIQFYISNTNGKTVTLYTQNGYVGEVHTTFTTGIGSLNGLTAPTQYFATGTSGTDFAISSSTATHTFNLPTASGTNRGALSSADWTTFNGKVGGSGTTNYVPKFTASGTIGNSQIFDNGTNVGIGLTSPANALHIDKGTGVASYTQYTAGVLTGQLATDGFEVGIDASANAVINQQENLPMLFYTNNTERMRLTAAGRLLIGGITESTYLLDVSGTARVRESLFMLRSDAAATVEALKYTSNGTVDIGNTFRVTGTNRWDNTTSSTSYMINGYSTKNFVITPTANGSYSGFDFSASSSFNPTIANPYTQKLINGAMTINSTAATNSFHGVSISTTDNSASIANNVFAVYADATLGTNTSATRWAGYFVGRIANTLGATFATSSGNVLIGTTTDAGYKLDVNGTARATSFLSTGKSFKFNDSGTQGQFASDGTDTYIDFVGAMRWRRGGGGVNFQFTSSSNFLIGISETAGYPLQVGGSGLFSNNQNGSTSLRVSNTTSGNNAQVQFEMIGSGGNFLLGKYSALRTPYKILSGDDSYLINQTIGDISILNDFSTGAIKFGAGGTSTAQMILTSGGNVGIGTTSPNASALLDITSTTKGFLPPRMTGAQAEAIATPATGLMVYANNGNGATITSTGWWGYNGTTWVKLN